MIYDDNNQGELFNNSMCAAGPHSSLNGEHMEEWKVENKFFWVSSSLVNKRINRNLSNALDRNPVTV